MFSIYITNFTNRHHYQKKRPLVNFWALEKNFTGFSDTSKCTILSIYICVLGSIYFVFSNSMESSDNSRSVPPPQKN